MDYWSMGKFIIWYKVNYSFQNMVYKMECSSALMILKVNCEFDFELKFFII